MLGVFGCFFEGFSLGFMVFLWCFTVFLNGFSLAFIVFFAGFYSMDLF